MKDLETRVEWDAISRVSCRLELACHLCHASAPDTRGNWRLRSMAWRGDSLASLRTRTCWWPFTASRRSQSCRGVLIRPWFSKVSQSLQAPRFPSSPASRVSQMGQCRAKKRFHNSPFPGGRGSGDEGLGVLTQLPSARSLPDAIMSRKLGIASGDAE